MLMGDQRRAQAEGTTRVQISISFVEVHHLEPGLTGFPFCDEGILDWQSLWLEVGRKDLRICYRPIKRVIFVQLRAVGQILCLTAQGGTLTSN